jgi:alkaline phosphatase
MKEKFLFCLLILGIQLNAQTSLRKAHAHNDYEHTKPFYEAFELGFGSIEADVFAINGQLLVAHEIGHASANRTLKSLYLDPIEKVLKEGKQGNFHLFLIDLKTSADSTMPLLIKALEPLAHLIQEKNIKIVVSGNRPLPKDYIKYPNWITFDGRKDEAVPSFSKNRIYLVSESIFKFGLWDGKSPMKPEMKAKLEIFVQQVHDDGKKIRLWATPDTLIAYQTLLSLGIDYIGTDHLSALADFLKTF